MTILPQRNSSILSTLKSQTPIILTSQRTGQVRRRIKISSRRNNTAELKSSSHAVPATRARMAAKTWPRGNRKIEESDSRVRNNWSAACGGRRGRGIGHIFLRSQKGIPFGSNRSAVAYMLDPLPGPVDLARLDRFIWEWWWSSNHRPEQWSISAGTRRASPSFLHGVPLSHVCVLAVGTGLSQIAFRPGS